MKIKDNKGSVTIFVLVGLLFMSSFLLISYANNLNKSKVVKEQFNLVSGIYSYNDGDVNAYNRAYTALRNANKQIITASVSNSSIIELNNTFEEKLSNYKIYGNSSGLGTYNSSLGKYVIQIKVTNVDGESVTYKVSLSSKLYTNEYIDYEKSVVADASGTKEVLTSLPTISTYEDYTKIQVTSGTPSKIEVKYTGYEFIS